MRQPAGAPSTRACSARCRLDTGSAPSAQWNPFHPCSGFPMCDTPFDTIIIGGGNAGRLLSTRLRAVSLYRLLLIESGSKDDYRCIHIPVVYLYCIGNPRTECL